MPLIISHFFDALSRSMLKWQW